MLELLAQYQYVFLFFGLLVGGETVLIPAVFLAIIGTFDFLSVILITIVATLLSDSVWYVIGRYRTWEKIKYVQKLQARGISYETFMQRFNAHALTYLFLSKFVYGTRILSQLLCGAHKLAYYKYIIVDIVAVLVWVGFLVGIAYLFDTSFSEFSTTISYVKLFILFTVIISLISVWIHRVIKRRWFQ